MWHQQRTQHNYYICFGIDFKEAESILLPLTDCIFYCFDSFVACCISTLGVRVSYLFLIYIDSYFSLLLFAAPTSHNVWKFPTAISIFFLLQFFGLTGITERKAMPVVVAIVVVAVTYCPAWLHLLFHHHFCFVLFLVLFFFLPHLVAHLKRFSTWAASFSLVALKRRFNSHFTWRVGTVGSSAMPTMPRCARWLPGHKWQSKLLAAVNRQIRERERTDCLWELLPNTEPQLKIQPKVGNSFYELRFLYPAEVCKVFYVLRT